MQHVPGNFLKKWMKLVEDMNPGDVGWMYPRCLQVDRNGVMFVCEGTIVFDKPIGRPNMLPLNSFPTNFTHFVTSIKIERLPDKTFVVDLNQANYKWNRSCSPYTSWRDAILVSLLEQTCSNP